MTQYERGLSEMTDDQLKTEYLRLLREERLARRMATVNRLNREAQAVWLTLMQRLGEARVTEWWDEVRGKKKAT